MNIEEMVEEVVEGRVVDAEEKEEYQVDGVPGALVKALGGVTAQDKRRYALNGFLLSGTKIVAADGGVLARIDIGEDLGPEAIVRVDKPKLRKNKECKLVRKGEGEDTELSITQRDGQSARIEYLNGMKGQFPNYTEVIPDGSGAQKFSCSIENLRKCLGIMEGAGHEHITFHITSDKSPALIKGLGEHSERYPVEFVISPVVCDEDTGGDEPEA